jgi:molybdopterin molybdotransferase
METMIDCDRALALVLAAARPLAARRVALDGTLDLVLAEPIAADRDYPPFDRAMMDGYAVRLADAVGRGSDPTSDVGRGSDPTPFSCEVIGEVAAGQRWDGPPLAPGQAIAIMTGAPCPPGTDAVVPHEDTRRADDSNRPRVRLPGDLKRGMNIQPRGREARAGQVVLEPGATLGPLALAVLASFGKSEVHARPRPTLSIIVTGNELISAKDTPAAEQIRDSNGPLLAAMAKRMGLTDVRLDRAADAMDSLRAALARAAASNIVVLTGGVSAGKYDLVPRALEEADATPIFHKVMQRPGRPLFFASRPPLPTAASESASEAGPANAGFGEPGHQLFFGLPGNPLSCHLCFHRYVTAAARAMGGASPEPTAITGRLAAPLTVHGPRVVFQLVRVESSEGGNVIHPLIGQGSADLFAAATANAILRVDPDAQRLEAGVEVTAEWMG